MESRQIGEMGKSDAFYDKDAQDRFWAKVNVGGPDECWDWLGATNSTGRGCFWVNGRTVLAHRVAWEIQNGPIPEGAVLLHSCDRGLCCNPAHLTPGSQQENARDMARRKRWRNQYSLRDEGE